MAKKDRNTVLVTGATGKQGGAVFRHLRSKNFPLRALTRNPEKPEAQSLVGQGADVVKADLSDPASLARALEDVDAVYSVQDFRGGLDKEVQEGKNLIDAANRAAISQFVYSSVGAADENTGIPHFESKFRIEEHLRQSGLPYTIIRPVFFMENWFSNKEQIDGGVLALPLSPETRLQMIAVDSIGAVAAALFEHPRRWQGRAVDLAGDELSMTEIATAFSSAVGHEVRYQQVPWEQFESQAGHEMTVMFRWFEEVGYHVDIAALRAEFPLLPTFEHWVNRNWGHLGSGSGRVAAAR